MSDKLPKEGLAILGVMLFLLIFGSILSTFSAVHYAGYAIAGLVIAIFPVMAIVAVYTEIKEKFNDSTYME